MTETDSEAKDNQGSASDTMRIAVIGTVHEATGRANETELAALLERISPEVLFLEMPAAALDDYMSGVRSNLESIAVNWYRERHRVELVPVDLPTPDAEFFQNIAEIGRRIRRKSADYCRLMSYDTQYMEQHGFAYLNSEYSDKLQSDLRQVNIAAMEAIGDQRLSDNYAHFTSTNQLRDHAMLENIESYCRRSSFRVGAFLIGAAHRQSIIEKSAVYSGSASSPIHWDFISPF